MNIIQAHKESKKILYLTIIFFLIVGSYWFLGLLKDTVFFKIAFPQSLGWPEGYGRLMQPIARLWSPLIVLFIVLCYSKLVDLVKKNQLFYILGTFFLCSFLIMGVLIWAKTQFGELFIGKNTLAYIGWIGFFLTDAYGSIMTTLFWSFAVSLTTVEEAKKGFPLIIAGAQLGSISGSLLTIVAKKINIIWPLYFIGCTLIALLMLMIYSFSQKFAINQHSQESKHSFFDFLSGITLLYRSSYLRAIFIISTFYEVAISIIDYQMKSFLDISHQFQGEIGFSTFQTIYGTAVNSCAFIIALVGSRYLLKKIGAPLCLIIYPVFICISLLFLMTSALTQFNPEYLLWSTFIILVSAKGITYGLNNPSRDIMYIPTSNDARFKTKGFTETFGSRAAIMTGATISNHLKGNLFNLVFLGSAISLGFVGIWTFAALYLVHYAQKAKK